MKERKKFFQTPRGTESFYLEEALLHRKATDALLDLFHTWGYLPVNTPAFDFFDTYRSLLDPEAEERIYRLIDREGDLLMLRSDITLFVAKQMGTSLTRQDLPVRVCYADSILRHQSQEDISHHEFFQVGAELIGSPGPKGDLEVLLLLLSSLRLLELPATVLHLGSRAFFNACFTERVAGPALHLLRAAILNRSWTQVEELLKAQRCRGAEAGLLLKLFSFIGARKEFAALKAGAKRVKILSEKAAAELDYLEEILNALERLSLGPEVHLDLAEIGHQPYYTGVVFQVYMPGLDSYIAAGGRYDGLLGFFGFEAPSVGFSLFLRKVEDRIANPERFRQRMPKVNLKEPDAVKAFQEAERLRAEGKIVTLGG